LFLDALEMVLPCQRTGQAWSGAFFSSTPRFSDPSDSFLSGKDLDLSSAAALAADRWLWLCGSSPKSLTTHRTPLSGAFFFGVGEAEEKAWTYVGHHALSGVRMDAAVPITTSNPAIPKAGERVTVSGASA
jgi:hypothetical protein